ncbi:MAG: shikimate kinase [Methanomassiliicoccales archaeon]|nr:shikimate kinase [Methanomassiliicoccales archaeon]
MHGAGTVINAIATGKGAAFGIGLETRAAVELDRSGRIEARMEGLKDEDDALARLCAKAVIDAYAPDEGYGAKVTTSSNIPVSKGLKSSSAAANAIVLATLGAVGEELDQIEAVRLGVKCAIEAGVSVTGAFDDACASMLGGLVITDNKSNMIVKRQSMPEDLVALIHVPSRQIRKKGLPLDRMRGLASVIDVAYQKVLVGKWQEAMLINSLAYSAALSLDPAMTVDAMLQGATAAGLSGTGPATVILVKERRLKAVRESLGGKDFIVADIYNGED